MAQRAESGAITSLCSLCKLRVGGLYPVGQIVMLLFKLGTLKTSLSMTLSSSENQSIEYGSLELVIGVTWQWQFVEEIDKIPADSKKRL